MGPNLDLSVHAAAKPRSQLHFRPANVPCNLTIYISMIMFISKATYVVRRRGVSACHLRSYGPLRRCTPSSWSKGRSCDWHVAKLDFAHGNLSMAHAPCVEQGWELRVSQLDIKVHFGGCNAQQIKIVEIRELLCMSTGGAVSEDWK